TSAGISAHSIATEISESQLTNIGTLSSTISTEIKLTMILNDKHYLPISLLHDEIMVSLPRISFLRFASCLRIR
ncbi:MAG: hypothetical protein NTX56_18765, partial [Proteobacteria bacterium]|nr:hypothetical protein [Pseudomonadota bacterium]